MYYYSIHEIFMLLDNNYFLFAQLQKVAKHSPTFFNLGIGQIYSIYFAGIVIDSFHNTEIFASNTFLKQNVGIAAVVPAFKLMEVLLSEEVTKNRQLVPEF